MKRDWKKLLALSLSLTLLAACAPKVSDPTPAPSEEVGEVVSPIPEADKTPVNVAVLKGATGLGAAKLMAQAEAEETANDYTFNVMAEPTEAVAALSKGEADIAALPTNLAATLYHKTEGEVQLLALNTLGVLYILENGDTVNSLADLAGRTVYAYGQGANPEYVLNYLLEKSGLDPAADVDIQWLSTTDEVTALMASGEADLCMLPVPAATGVLIKNPDVRAAVDLTQVWNDTGAEGVLTMGCVVVRKAFAEEHPEAVKTFLSEYKASIDFMADPTNVEDAAALAETYGIVPKAAVAKRALPDANLCFITGEEMVTGIQGYYEVLFAANPASIGGSIPDGAFFYDANA